MDLVGKAAIVTGGAGGLGAATARRLVELDAKVVIFDLDGEGAERLARSLGRSVVAVAGDVADDSDVTPRSMPLARLVRSRYS